MPTLLAPLLLALAAPQLPAIQVSKAIAIGGVVRAGRVPIPVDTVLASIAAQGLAGIGDRPINGIDGKPAAWKPIEAKPDGWFEDDALGGGYVLANLAAPDDGVYILNASGHSAAYIGGDLRFGDPYGYGYLKQPVLLKKGDNPALFLCSRGRLRVVAERPLAPIQLDGGDPTLPDVVLGVDNTLFGSVVVINSTQTAQDVVIAADFEGAHTTTKARNIPAMSSRKANFQFQVPRGLAVGEHVLKLQIESGLPLELKVNAVGSRETHKRTFVSEVDGSVQYYAVNPAQSPSPSNALVLTLHGASVEGIGQARAYASKPWASIVAPTNRRPYGFDWEDVGRLDALEVLGQAEKSIPHDPSRVSLTGHSMGGHGTWHLGLTFPDKWAAIAPSAGWSSFFSYAGTPRIEGEGIPKVMSRALQASDTMNLVRNSLAYPLYILHGDADDNVPVSEARTMRDALTFNPRVTYHEQPGAGHWWGNECVDWPPLFDVIEKARIPADADVQELEFHTASPWVSSKCHWVEVEQQQQPMAPSTIKARLSGMTLGVDTANIERFRLDMRPFKDVVRLEVDGQTVMLPVGTKTANVARTPEGWNLARSLSPKQKTPARSGPFKSIFNHRFVFVYGTKAATEEASWMRASAIGLAEAFQYRGNGSVEVVADKEFDPKAFKDRNVLLFGNMDTNTAWKSLLPNCPIRVQSGMVSIGGKPTFGHGLTCLFVYPRPDSNVAEVAAIATTGPEAWRIAERLPILTSGIAYPDWCVIGSDAPSADLDSIVAAGFFGNDWSVVDSLSEWARVR